LNIPTCKTFLISTASLLLPVTSLLTFVDLEVSGWWLRQL